MNHFALNQATYCPSCDTVGDDLTRCACCRATSLLVLATVLNRSRTELLHLNLLVDVTNRGRELQRPQRESAAQYLFQALLPTRD